MADLILGLDWDISKAEAKQRKLNRKYDESQKKADLIAQEMKKTEESLEEQYQKQAKLNDEAGKTIQKMDEILQKREQLNSITSEADRKAEAFKLDNEYAIAEKDLQRINTEREKSLDTEKKLDATLAKQNLKLKQQNNKTAEIGDEIVLNSQKSEKSGFALGKVFDKITKRLTKIALNAFIFSAITKALRALKSAITEKINADSGFNKYLSEIRGNTAVIIETLYQSAKPIIEWILQKVAYITQLLAVILARVLHKDVNEMRKFAQQSKKASKEAEKTLASWDTLQQIKTDSGSGDSSGASASFGQFDGAKWTEEELLKIEAIAAGALLALGCLLAFSCVNIPLGLALIAAGAIILAREVIPNWNKMSDETKRSVSGILGMIAGATLVALGVILMMSGVGAAIGIPLIIAGIAAFGIGALTMNWDKMKEDTQNAIAKIVGIFAGYALIAIGVMLCMTGAGIPFGLALILAGVQQMRSGATWDGNMLLEKIRTLKDNICIIFTSLWDFIKTGNKESLQNAINKIIDGLNWVVKKANSLIASILDSGWASALFGSFNTSTWRIPEIPYVSFLAKGAVIPGGKPFPAVLGDQPRGKTNLEAPEDLIRQIVREETGNITVNFTGTMAQLVRAMNPEITREQNRSTLWAGGTK